MRSLVSVVITTKNEERYLKKALDSIKTQTYKNIEIIVSDSCSSDRTVQIARKFTNNVFVKSTNIPKGRNYGGQKARGEFLIFLDADTFLKKNWIENAIKNFSSKKVGLVVGSYVSIQRSRRAKGMTWIRSEFLPTFFSIFGLPGFTGPQTFMTRKEIFKKLKGYNEKMRIFEDLDFAIRIKKNWEVVHDRDCISYSSMRRFEKNGYIKESLYWFVQGVYYRLTGKVLEKTYKTVR